MRFTLLPTALLGPYTMDLYTMSARFCQSRRTLRAVSASLSAASPSSSFRRPSASLSLARQTPTRPSSARCCPAPGRPPEAAWPRPVQDHVRLVRLTDVRKPQAPSSRRSGGFEVETESRAEVQTPVPSPRSDDEFGRRSVSRDLLHGAHVHAVRVEHRGGRVISWPRRPRVRSRRRNGTLTAVNTLPKSTGSRTSRVARLARAVVHVRLLAVAAGGASWRGSRVA